MQTVEYDEKISENTETHVATDQPLNKKFGKLDRAYEEGFASASGVRGETADTGGRVKNPERGDADTSGAVATDIDEENAGLADS